MSFSIGAKGATKEAVKAALAEQFEKQVLPHQPIHAKDKEQALAAAGAYVDILGEQEGWDIAVSISGSLGWNTLDENGEPRFISGAGVNVSANLVVHKD